MKVKEQLINDLLKYPSIIKNKWGAYHQWFCVSGNNMVWKNGELVDLEDENHQITIQEAIEKSFYDFEEDLKDNIVIGKIYPHQIQKLKENILMINCLEGRINDFNQSEPFFELTEDSPLLHIPKDIKDDWKDALNEFLTWIKNNLDKIDFSSKCMLNNEFSYSLVYD